MIVIVMGVSGSGKSVTGRTLAEELGWPFFEADEFHPDSNIDKMKRGIPLSESDRTPWLGKIARLVSDLDRDGRSAVIACSALRHSYRKTVAGQRRSVRFVYLKGGYELIRQRIGHRKGHFMSPALLDSQFDVLEEPADAIMVRAEQPVLSLVAQIRKELGV